jgi:hypothetical protein
LPEDPVKARVDRDVAGVAAFFLAQAYPTHMARDYDAAETRLGSRVGDTGKKASQCDKEVDYVLPSPLAAAL